MMRGTTLGSVSLSAEQFADDQAYALNNSRAMQGLTSKQYRFATFVFQGHSLAEAYRQAGYGVDMNELTRAKEGARLARHPLVVAKLTELRREVDKQTTLAPSLSRTWITEGIMAIAQSGDKDSTRLAAYIALGKVVGIDLFRETVTHETKTRTIDEIDAELRARLKDLQPVIDGTSRHTETLPATSDRRRKPKA